MGRAGRVSHAGAHLTSVLPRLGALHNVLPVTTFWAATHSQSRPPIPLTFGFQPRTFFIESCPILALVGALARSDLGGDGRRVEPSPPPSPRHGSPPRPRSAPMSHQSWKSAAGPMSGRWEAVDDGPLGPGAHHVGLGPRLGAQSSLMFSRLGPCGSSMFVEEAPASPWLPSAPWLNLPSSLTIFV